MDLFKKCYDYTMAKEAMAAGLYPYFHALQSGQDTVVTMSNKENVLMIGSNNYLGLTSDPRVIQAAIEATTKYGSGCSGSRFLNGTLDLHVTLEERLARFMKKEKALLFSAGFLANLGIISAIAGRGDYILCDRANHASIYDGCRLSFAKMYKYGHNDMDELEYLLQKLGKDAPKLIITDGVFSMEGDLANLPAIVRLARDYNARILLDDAHGIGRARGADESVDLFFGDQLLERRHGLGGVAGVVQGNIVHRQAADFGGQQGHGVFLGYAHHGGGPRRRGDDADFHLGQRRGGPGGEQQGDGGGKVFDRH